MRITLSGLVDSISGRIAYINMEISRFGFRPRRVSRRIKDRCRGKRDMRRRNRSRRGITWTTRNR
jgi:hypothetical protein